MVEELKKQYELVKKVLSLFSTLKLSIDNIEATVEGAQNLYNELYPEEDQEPED